MTFVEIITLIEMAIRKISQMKLKRHHLQDIYFDEHSPILL